MRRVKLATAAAGVAVAMLGAACGTKPVAQQGTKIVIKSPERLIAASADVTTKAKTARIAMKVSMSGSAFAALGKDVAIDMDGAIAFDGSQAEFTMDLGSIMPGAPAGTKVEARVVDGVMYMDMGTLLRGIAGSTGEKLPGLFDGVKWLKLDTHGLAGGAGGVGSSSPSQYTQYLEYLRGASKGGITTVGKEPVRGVETTHYRAELDRSKIAARVRAGLDKMTPTMRELLQKGIDAIANGTGQIGADVWIDNNGVTRRLDMDLPIPIPNAGGDVKMALRLEFYDFGVGLDVQAPPASETRDFSDLGSLTGATTS